MKTLVSVLAQDTQWLRDSTPTCQPNPKRRSSCPDGCDLHSYVYGHVDRTSMRNLQEEEEEEEEKGDEEGEGGDEEEEEENDDDDDDDEEKKKQYATKPRLVLTHLSAVTTHALFAS